MFGAMQQRIVQAAALQARILGEKQFVAVNIAVDIVVNVLSV